MPINVAVDTNNTIADVLSRINNQPYGIFLPYIQRDFVWDEDHICELLDSLMRGYPMGTILVWETNKPVNYRLFVENYNPNQIDYDFFIGNDNQVRDYVLDGQQRLQSLYLAMHGTYDGKVLFFDLFSNPKNGYRFEFCALDTPEGDGCINVPKFLQRNDEPDFNIIDELINSETINPINTNEEKILILNNARRLYNIFNFDHNIPIQRLGLNVRTNKNEDIPLKDIAEIFVRTNSGGVVLDATDLVMATITSEWAEANQEFNELVSIIQNMGFKNPRLFILQSCFAILLNNGSITPITIKNFALTTIQDQLKKNFSNISVAINDVLQFVKKISEESSLGTFKIPFYNPILILVAYRYAHGKDNWEKSLKAAQAFLFTAFLCKDLTKPTQRLMKSLLDYVSNKQNDFDMTQIKRIFNNNNKDFKVEANDLLDIRLNAPISSLVLYLIYSGQPGFDAATMKIHGHIFSRGRLKALRKGRRQRYTQNQYDSIINCALITANENDDQDVLLPAEYLNSLGSQKEKFLKLHAIPQQYHDGINLWNIDNYEAFLAVRRELLVKRISENLGLLVPPVDNNTITTILKNFKHLFVRSNKN